MITLHSEQMIAAAKAPNDAYESTRTAWKAEVSADTEISAYTNSGKTGLDAVKVDIGRALGTLEPTLAANFREAMNITGAGDNPAFIKAFWKLSQHITEGKHVAGAQPSPHGQRQPGTTERPSAAASLYPNLPH